MDPRMKIINEAESFLRKKLGGIQPEIGVVLGSGLGKFGDQIEPIVTIPYKDIPNFVTSTAMGHKGNFIIGKVSGNMSARCRAVSTIMKDIRWMW